MNRKFVIIISIATALLVALLIALSVFRSSPQPAEQLSDQVLIPTSAPNNQSLSPNISSNADVQLSATDSSAIDTAAQKLPFDSDNLKVAYSELLNTFYVQNSATDEAQLKQFLEENNLANLYKTNPKLFKFTNQDPRDVKDEDEFAFISKTGIGETQDVGSNTPLTDQQKQLEVAKGFLGLMFDYSIPDPEPTIQVTPQTGLTAAPSTGAVPAANCDNVVGNEKIVCSALKYTGIRYGFSPNAAGNQKSKDMWGIVSQGSNGHDPANWIAKRVPGGANDFLECSGYVAVAIYDAFGVVADHCSVNYYGAANFKKIDINAARPGDLLIKGTACASAGGGGHIGIFVQRYANGRIQTLESTPRGTGKTGYYEVSPTFFTRAVRYTGPGSTP